jgi:glyoxylase-like metal-dependent hydrolase (beta-lactamase superfamily II)
MSDGHQRLGEVEILALSDAIVEYPWPLTDIFPGVPLEAWAPYREHYPAAFGGENIYRSDYGCYLMRSQGHTILVDAGMGPQSAPLATAFGQAGQLLPKLRAGGVAAEEIDLVILSHLHPDHVGWALQGEGTTARPTFPRARYLVHRLDWEAFQRPEVQALFPFPYMDQTVTPLQSLGVLDLIEGDYAITGELRTLHTPGHTPGHISILVDSAGERGILICDVAIHPAQVTEPDWNTMFELDGEMARTTRHAILDRIEAEGMQVVACHFPEPGFGQIVRLAGRRYWQAH